MIISIVFIIVMVIFWIAPYLLYLIFFKRNEPLYLIMAFIFFGLWIGLNHLSGTTILPSMIIIIIHGLLIIGGIIMSIINK